MPAQVGNLPDSLAADFHFILAVLKIPFSLIPRNDEKIAWKRATITRFYKIFIFSGGFRGKSEGNLILINSFSIRFCEILFNILFTNTPKRQKNCMETCNYHTIL